jgi:hypothetical protein
MISAVIAIKAFFASVMALASFLILGAAIAFVGWMIARFFGPSLSGLIAALGVGAAVMFLAVTGNWLADNSKQVAELKRALELKQAKLEEIRATSEALRETLARLSEAAQYNEGVMTDLRAKLDAVPDKPDCMIDEGIVDELNKIR